MYQPNNLNTINENNINDSEEKELIDSFDFVTKKLEKQITTIELRQQELQNYMNVIDNHINNFDLRIAHELQKSSPNYDSINRLRAASFKNVELMTVLHNSYKEYEGVKFRYFKEISDNNYKKHRLTKVDIKKVGDVKDAGMEFFDIMRKLSQLNLDPKSQINENSKLLGLEVDESNELIDDIDYQF